MRYIRFYVVAVASALMAAGCSDNLATRRNRIAAGEYVPRRPSSGAGGYRNRAIRRRLAPPPGGGLLAHLRLRRGLEALEKFSQGFHSAPRRAHEPMSLIRSRCT